MKNVVKTVLAYGFLTLALWTVFLNMSVAGSLLVILPCLTVAYFIVQHRERARKAKVETTTLTVAENKFAKGDKIEVH